MQKGFDGLSRVVGKLLADRWMTRRNTIKKDERSTGPAPVAIAEKGKDSSSPSQLESSGAASFSAESASVHSS